MSVDVVAGQTVSEVCPSLPQLLGRGVCCSEGAAVWRDLLLARCQGAQPQLSHHLAQGEVPVLRPLRGGVLLTSIMILGDGGQLCVEVGDPVLGISEGGQPHRLLRRTTG